MENALASATDFCGAGGGASDRRIWYIRNAMMHSRQAITAPMIIKMKSYSTTSLETMAPFVGDTVSSGEWRVSSEVVL